MKDKKKVIEKDEMPSKGKIAAAWFFLIVLICCTGGLVYLKNFSQLETEVTDGDSEPSTSSAITTALTGIVEKFNASTLVSTYQTEGLTLIASVQDATIVVSYANTEANGSVIYTYTQDPENHNIATSFQNSTKEINDKIFKAMVLACRERIGETEDVSSKIDEFLNGTTEAPGLTKKTTEISNTYSINIVTPLKEVSQNNPTNETTNNENTTNTTTSVITDNTTSTTDNNTTTETQTTPNENSTTNNTSAVR